ncbi:hypothetical protein H5399_12750 [Tessaracoccus sp. MC1627]|uniref:hypothetical protein n=1 Tax=Tessaracoccus sp. MC1627 TaxID=2760312 RepID=UPI0015FF3547|nr:hypothetical protein [Tessaracoccus sp. MC1627]MBB1513204.1 hypothetical protein [Tessaracoccus sp. MC1627]MBB1513463.1 hypothetical protein [Tessaracoccus sp. MC1627]
MTFERFTQWAATSRSSALVVIFAAGGVVWLSAASVPWVTVPTIIDPDRGLVSVLAGVAGVLGALAATLAASILLARLQTSGGVLGYPGRLSHQIYLSHVIFTAGTRVALVRIGIVDPATHLALGTAAGIAGPLVLEQVTRGLPWLFAPPCATRRAATTVAGPRHG